MSEEKKVNEVNPKTIKVEDGKVIIENDEAIKQLMDQGMQFKDDGSLDLDDGQNISVSLTVSI